MNKELFKVEYFIKLSQYFENLAKAVKRSHTQNIPQQNSKFLAELNVTFNSEKFLIYVLPKFNRNLICAGCYLYYLIGNLTQDVYSRRFSHVNNEFNVTNV